MQKAIDLFGAFVRNHHRLDTGRDLLQKLSEATGIEIVWNIAREELSYLPKHWANRFPPAAEIAADLKGLPELDMDQFLCRSFERDVLAVALITYPQLRVLVLPEEAAYMLKHREENAPQKWLS